MLFREASIPDIPQIQIVRNSVRENTLSDPGLVTDADCADYLTRRGKGWVCTVDDLVVGFWSATLMVAQSCCGSVHEAEFGWCSLTDRTHLDRSRSLHPLPRSNCGKAYTTTYQRVTAGSTRTCREGRCLIFFTWRSAKIVLGLLICRELPSIVGRLLEKHPGYVEPLSATAGVQSVGSHRMHAGWWFVLRPQL